MQTATRTDRRDIRKLFFEIPGTTHVDIGENEDGTWFVAIYDLHFEAPSAAAALRTLAEILEES